MRRLRLLGFYVLTGLCVPLWGQTHSVSGHVRVINSGGAAQDSSSAVVYLTSHDPQATGRLVPGTARLVQHGKRFSPHLVVLTVGSTVEFPNHDPFFHNVFSVYQGTRFDLGLYESGSSKTVIFGRPGASYIFCNIHPEMSAVVLALTTPYYAITDHAGNYRILDVPPGDYDLHVWFERANEDQLQRMTRSVTVSANESLPSIAITAVPSLAQGHKNKYGKDYDMPPGYQLP